MKKYTVPIILAFTLSLFLILLMATTPSQALPNQPEGQPAFDLITDIYTSRQMQEGIVSTSFQSIYGPDICTDWGDPFSPFHSRYAPGLYSYRYRIEIPVDYPSDFLRVEIFDPDSMNAANNTASFLFRSQAAQDAGGLDLFITGKDCDSSNRKNPCLIPTGEIDDWTSPTYGDPVGNLSLDQVNPFWFMRVDENRGNGTNACQNVSGYSTAVNTLTEYTLYYYKENPDGTVEAVPLAQYIGQDGTEAVDHETDLHWVSPGADEPFGYDKPGRTVPVTPNYGVSEKGFEIDLTHNIPGIITEQASGNRYIYLDVRTIKGGSENGFELWAGPKDYAYGTGVPAVASQVNSRNIEALNNPSVHNSRGVKVYAISHLPQNSNASFPVDLPLTSISPDQAGNSVYISMFDSDGGASPPITFYFDTIAEDDWSLTFGAGGLDPDGITATLRCRPGSCHDEWIDPPYEIKLPKGTKECDFNNPTSELCTPFYGGKLMARYEGGELDTYVWRVSAPKENPQNPTRYQGCDAFPIGIHEGVRSVTNPNDVGGNPYPDRIDIEGNNNPPTYQSFIHHQDNIPLLSATEGTVYKVQQGMGSGNFGWLVWNTGIAGNNNTLGDSLAWPGNIMDYTNHGDGGLVLPGQDHVVRGYVEPGDSSDTELHLEDWIAASTGSINSSSNRAIIGEHISLGRVLRLPIWNNSQNSGIYDLYQTAAFASFRIHGYHLSQGGSWILLEFIRFDNSCGQSLTPLTDVTIEGLTHTPPNEDVTFTAVSTPVTATQPISYTWEATDFAPITQSNSISDTMTFNWSITGTKTIMVTAENFGNTVTSTHTITVSNLAQGADLTIIGAPQLITPLPLIANTPVEFAVTVKNLGYTDISSQFSIDLFVNPTTLNPNGIPLAQSNGTIALGSLNSGESKTVNITIPAGLLFPNSSHQIYAMVDSVKTIPEAEETNNISSPSTLYDYHFIVPPTEVTIDGYTFSLLNEDVIFTADVVPLTTTQPISYTWEATDFAHITQSNGISDTISFNWATTGQKTITVTAVNAAGIVTDTHTITVSDLVQGTDLTIMGAPQLVTPLPIGEGTPIEFAVTVKNLGDTAVSQQSFINLYVNPNTIPAATSDGFNLLYDLDPGESKTINVTLANGLSIPDTPHQIYAMVDSDNEITEVDESNNISAPLSLDASNFAEKKFIYLPIIIKN